MQQTDILPTPVNKKPNLKKEKINDVAKLLTKHYGEEWESNENLNYYKCLLNQPTEDGEIENNDVDECCEFVVDLDIDNLI